MRERWMPVVGVEGRYEVSDQGRVRSFVFRKTGVVSTRPVTVLKQRAGAAGYLRVCLSPGKPAPQRVVHVHRLVLEAFRGFAPAGHAASHLDGVRSNNRLVNLRWEDHKANNMRKRAHGTNMSGERHPAFKLTSRQVAAIRREREAGATLVSIAAKYGITHSYVAALYKRKSRQSDG